MDWTLLSEPLQYYATWFTIGNILEIGIITAALHYFFSWLAHDYTKPLLIYALTYCYVLLCTWAYNLATLSLLMLCASPIIVSIFLLIHHTTLQKYLLVTHHIPKQASLSSSTYPWITNLIRTMVQRAHEGKSTRCCIACSDALDDFFYAHEPLYAPITPLLINLVLDGYQNSTNDSFILMTTNTIISLNAQCTIAPEMLDWVTITQKIDPWHEYALLLTSKTDSIFVGIDSATKLFTLINNGTITQQLTTHEITMLLKKLLTQPIIKTKEHTHEASSQPSTYKIPQHRNTLKELHRS